MNEEEKEALTAIYSEEEVQFGDSSVTLTLPGVRLCFRASGVLDVHSSALSHEHKRQLEEMWQSTEDDPQVFAVALAAQQMLECETELAEEEEMADPTQLERRLYLFHHIYSERKKEKILREAKELRIGGYLLTGKPGIAWLEGEPEALREWNRVIRALSWQCMTLKVEQTGVSSRSYAPEKGLTQATELAEVLRDEVARSLYLQAFGSGGE